MARRIRRLTDRQIAQRRADRLRRIIGTTQRQAPQDRTARTQLAGGTR